MAQYSKYVRPGFKRVEVDYEGGWGASLQITAYKKGAKVVVVLLNTGSSPQTVSVGINAGAYDSFKTVVSSGTKNLEEGSVTAAGNVASVTLEATSVTTLIGGE